MFTPLSLLQDKTYVARMSQVWDWPAVTFKHNGDEDMNKQAAEMTRRIQRAVKSGKSKLDEAHTIPQLVASIGATRAQLCEPVNREFGSVTRFCAHIGFAGKK